MTDQTEGKRGPGRPSKAELEARERATSPRYKMKAKPNWEDVVPADDIDTPDRLRIPRDEIPEGMDLQWVTDSVFGQDMSQHRSGFEKKGWTPVHQSDFDGIYDGRFMPKGRDGEIKVDGLVLMARPLEMSLQAKKLDYRRAREQVKVKEDALFGGDIKGVTLDTQHPSALQSNRINKTVERLEVPRDDR